ncbi:hypothetical protein VPHK436_0022 [Vibrio phage K436]
MAGMTWHRMLKYRKAYNLLYLKHMRDAGHKIVLSMHEQGDKSYIHMYVDGKMHIGAQVWRFADQPIRHKDIRRAVESCINIGLNKPLPKRITRGQLNASKN